MLFSIGHSLQGSYFRVGDLVHAQTPTAGGIRAVHLWVQTSRMGIIPAIIMVCVVCVLGGAGQGPVMFLKMANAHTHTNSLTHRDSYAVGAPEWLRYTACIAGSAEVHSTDSGQEDGGGRW